MVQYPVERDTRMKPFRPKLNLPIYDVIKKTQN